jgi:hypothetical protein
MNGDAVNELRHVLLSGLVVRHGQRVTVALHRTSNNVKGTVQVPALRRASDLIEPKVDLVERHPVLAKHGV